MTVSQSDIDTIRAAILRNVPPNEREVAIALFNVGLEALTQVKRMGANFERLAIAMEKIANDVEP